MIVMLMKDFLENGFDKYMERCNQYKLAETREILSQFYEIGQMIIQIPKLKEDIQKFDKNMIMIEENIENSFKLNRIAGGLKECLNEIYRRNESSRKMNNLVGSVKHILSNDRELELIKRQSFRLSYGDIILPSLMPSFVDAEKDSNIPNFNLNDYPIEFPELEETKSLSDEFDLVLLGDPKEKIKQLERDNTILNDRIKILLQMVKDIEKEKKSY